MSWKEKVLFEHGDGSMIRGILTRVNLLCCEYNDGGEI